MTRFGLVKRRTSHALVILSLVILLLVGLRGFGPTEPVPVAVSYDPAQIGQDVSSYLADNEAKLTDIRADAAKEIVWAYPQSKAKTPLAIVYVHGFSASKAELRPVPDEVAQRLNANLFLTRLAGHGRNEVAMAEPDVEAWLNDLAEAVAIGRRIGERVIIIGTSNGGSLTTYGASIPGLLDDVAGLVLISPNYGVQDWRSFLLTMPFARDLVPTLYGKTYGTAPDSQAAEEAAETYGWTRSFPTVALLPMAAIAQAAAAVDVNSLTVPALFIYSPQDKVVDPQKIADLASQWGGPHQVVEVQNSTDPSQHLLAGDLRSPETTEAVVETIVMWVQSLN
ncbi:lysophospholipase [Aureimonas fodinaquatilis]|uniref:Lysophospholipase n=2 Tax=Aureimonas fodinaquatilis TaxID=2565783 RepID=A0A5B0E0H2_9HYPH|nr:lysophospholipase [Aureimonas fodinaquatilis]